MKCQLCSKEATIHLTEVVDGNMMELHLCEQCAQMKGLELTPQISLNELLSGLVDFTAQEDPSSPEVGTCATCGMKYKDFKKTGRLGCALCYDAFRQMLLPVVQKVQGANQHMGKRPGYMSGAKGLEAEVAELSVRLKTLVDTEEFEQAALVRDKIKLLQQQMKDKKS